MFTQELPHFPYLFNSQPWKFLCGYLRGKLQLLPLRNPTSPFAQKNQCSCGPTRSNATGAVPPDTTSTECIEQRQV
ncbi:hypothetical protein VZT92_019679 [Zoarces viviparus]|uniref:Uncharacterized protein n=1 Tax=Zoarces viviparus TaxID=48416 RepID=A0AAW1ELP4_ZOAVI